MINEVLDLFFTHSLVTTWDFVNLIVKVLTLSLPHSLSLSIYLFVGGVFTHFAVTRQCATRWDHGEIHCLEPPSRLERKWTHRSFFFTPLPTTTRPHLLSLSLFPSLPLPLSLIHPRHWADNPKRSPMASFPCPSLLFLFHNKKKRENRPEGVSLLITQGR